MSLTPKQLIALMCEQRDMHAPISLKLEIYTGRYGESKTTIDIEDLTFDNGGVITFQPCDAMPLNTTLGET